MAIVLLIVRAEVPPDWVPVPITVPLFLDT